ncbi:serine/threonine-protein kinase [Cellulomonas sp. KRMCY2]|uniref:serine/threonine-protein kinase n=1 Tax=Cellulomonas sp. KRMCY2 TaxID=1304865 RepID=UPI00045EC2B0|nr:serine/threonine-protein kinase [Cellulomonas sp. KRMCY2]
MPQGSPDVVQGTVLDGRYRIDEFLGQGGMATVYRAHDELLGRDVAIKLFPATPDVAESERHQAEMRLLARLSHPGLVTLHDAGSALAGGHLPQTYLVMELVDGPTLATRIAGGPLSPVHAARVGGQLAEALVTVHEAGVVHRDIKPANVLLVGREVAVAGSDAAVTTGPIVKLADFGIARLTDGARLTMTGTTLGTAMYLSPEQAAGRTVGPPADVYSLGLVLLECLTGAKPFTGTLIELASVRLNSDPTIPPDLPAGWRDLLAAMTHREAIERPTMADAAVRLADLAGSGSSPAGTTLSTERFTVELAESTAVLPAATAGSTGPPPRIAPAPADAERTRAFTPGEVLAVVRGSLELPLDDPDDDLPGPDNPATARPGGPRRRAGWLHRPAVLAAAAATVAVLALGAKLALPDEQAAEPAADPSATSVEYPVVDGSLGAALDALARSVEP